MVTPNIDNIILRINDSLTIKMTKHQSLLINQFILQIFNEPSFHVDQICLDKHVSDAHVLGLGVFIVMTLGASSLEILLRFNSNRVQGSF